jgi:hypothetical protein
MVRARPTTIECNTSAISILAEPITDIEPLPIGTLATADAGKRVVAIGCRVARQQRRLRAPSTGGHVPAAVLELLRAS